MSLPPPIKKRARRGRQRRLARIAAETSAVSVHLSEIDSMEEGEIELNGSGAAETGRPEATPREKSPHHFSANGFGEVEPNRVCQVGQQTWYNAAPSQDFAINWAHDGAQKSAPTMPSGGRGYRRDPLEQPGTLAELQPQTRYQPQPQTRYRHHTESQFQPHPENWFQPQPGPQARFQLQPQMGSQPQPQTWFQPQSGPWSTPQQSSQNWYPPAGSGDCGDRDRGVRDDRCTYGDARNYFVRDGDDGGRGEGTGGGDGGDSASVENMRRSKSMSRGNRSAPSQVQDDLDRSAAFDRDATGWSNGHEEGSEWWFEPKETQQLCEWPSPAAAVGFDGDTAVHRNTASLGSTVGSVADGVDGREKRDTFLNNSRHCRVGAPRSGFHDDLEIPEGDRRRSERTSSQSNSGMFGAAHAANRLGEKSYGTDARESGGDRIGRIDLPMRPFSPEADVDLRENAGTCGRTNFLVSGKASEERTHGNYHQPERDSWQQPQFDPWKQSGKWPRSYDDAATSVDVSVAGSSRATEGLTDEVSASPFVAAAATVGDSGRFPAPTGANCEWSHEAGFQRYSGQPLQHVAPTSWDAGGVNIGALGLPSESVVVGDNTRVPVGETQMAAAKAVAKAPPGRSAEDLEREEQLWKRLQMPRKSKPQLPLQPQPPPPPPPPPPLPPPQWLPPQPLLHPPQLLKPPQTLQPPQPLLQLPPQPLLQLPPQPSLPKPTPLPPQQLTPQPPLPKPTPLQPSQPPPPQPPLQSSQLRADEPPQPQRAGHPSSQAASGRAQPLVVASLNAPVHDAGVDTAAADRFVYSNKDSALSSTRVVEAATRKVSEQTTGEHDAQRKRAARRNWRSASQNFALVLVGVANLPRKVCSKVAKIPSAIWVDRHELADPSSLPLEVKATLAKVLAERMLPCGSCDQSESGRDHLLLMTFTSLDAKEIAVRNLAELGVDTADFDNSRCVQVEQASALCFKPSSSPLPPQQQTAPKPGAQTPPAITIKSRKDPNPKAESKVARTKAEAKDAASKASLSSRVKQAREKALKGLQIERRIAAEAKAKAAEAKAAEAEAKVKAAGLETEAKAAELEAKAKAEAAEAEAKVKSLESEAKAKVAEVNAKADTKRNAAASARVSDTTGASSQAMGSDEARGARRSESTHGDHSLGVTRPAKARAHSESGAPAKAASSDEARDDRRLESMRGDRPALVKRSADVVAKARASYGSGSLLKAAGAEETWGTSESKHNGRLVGVKWPAAAPAAGQALDIAPQSAAKRARVQLPRSGTTGDGIESKEENSGQAKDFKAALKTVKSGRSGTAAEVARVQVQAIPAASTGPSKAAETTSKTSALPRPVRPETSESEKYIAASMPATSVAVSAAAAAMPRDARITETSAKRASPSPVRQERRTPSPPVPHATSRKVGVGQAGAIAAAPGPRALSPPRYHAVRGVGLVKPTNGAGNAERVLPQLKALNKRLVVTRPSRLPDPTIQHWHYGFSGKYFKLQDRDPKTGEALPSCDPSKNSSYVGVIPSTEVLLEGLREHVKQRRAAEAAAAGTTGAASVAAPAPTPAAHAATVSTGAPNITRRKTSALSSTDTEDHRTGALTARVAPPIRRKMPSPSLAGNMAFQNERKAAEKGGKGSVREVYRGGGAVAVSSAGRGETEKVGEGKSRSRIREAEEELRSLQEIKIPRVTKALADVSKQRRKIEAVVTSIAAKTAAAHARLAQDSRDAASALMEELRAKREFSQRQRHQKKQQQQQHRDSQTHGGKAIGGISAGVKAAVPTKLSQAQSFSGSSKSGRPDIPERS